MDREALNFAPSRVFRPPPSPLAYVKEKKLTGNNAESTFRAMRKAYLVIESSFKEMMASTAESPETRSMGDKVPFMLRAKESSLHVYVRVFFP